MSVIHIITVVRLDRSTLPRKRQQSYIILTVLNDGSRWVSEAVERVSERVGRSQRLTVTASEPVWWLRKLEKNKEISREQTERFLHVLP